jgi:mannitol/fructose-specific phosphotransferase system IIA component (Ntr-type)
MSYDVIRLAADKLTYREKMKLSQYLIQAAIKEEEDLNPTTRNVPSQKIEKPKAKSVDQAPDDLDIISYVKERLVKSKPSKKQSLINFISAMFQFQGGIEENKINAIISRLEKEGILTISGAKVVYA